MKKTKFKMTENGSGIEEVSESSCLCASVLKKNAGVVEGCFNTETQRLRGTELKMTEIGLIPEDWDVKRLGDVSSNFNYGVGAEAVPYIEGPRYIRITDIDENSHKFTPDQTVAAAFSDPNSIVNDGDILVARTGASVGKSYLYDKSDGDLIFAGFLMRFHPIEVISAYVYRQTLTGRYWQWIASESARSGQPGINIQQLKSFQIPVPPLHEQKAIAEVLSDVDELLAAMTTLIEKKRAIKQGAMQELLTGKKRLVGFKNSASSCLCASVLKKDVGVVEGDFNTETQRRRGTEFKMTEIGLIPEDWEVKKLGDVCKIIMGQSPASVYYNIKGNGLPLIQGNADLEKRKSIIRFYTSQITKICDVGDVVLSVRAPVGAVGKAEYKSCLGRGVCALKYENDYLYQYLLFVEDKWGEFSKGSTFDSINSNELAEYKLPLPPTLAEQRAIAEVLSDMDAEIAALEADRAKYESIKQGMMQELLTGKTRLV